MRLRSIFIAIFILLIQVQTWAQTTAASTPDMASELRQSGKIYVVVLVIATIFAGIILFLILLDRKVRKLEQRQ